MPKVQVVKWGNSLAVRIPKAVAEEAQVKEGDAIVIKAAKGRIVLQPCWWIISRAWTGPDPALLAKTRSYISVLLGIRTDEPRRG